MAAYNILERIKQGEDSFTQFKENIFEAKKVAEEMVAFSNASGGDIIIGVMDNGTISGLNDNDINRLNQLISNTANENVKPPIYPLVEVQHVDGKKILVVSIRNGTSKPYSTGSGLYITKSGADKRKMSQAELKRLFAESSSIFADEELVQRSNLSDLNTEAFYSYLEKKDKEVYIELKSKHLDLETILQNLDLLRGGHLTLAGNLLFGKNPQQFNKSFYIQAVHFTGFDVDADHFVSKETIIGSIYELYKQSMNFIKSNLKRVQDCDNFNTPGILEIPEESIIEAVINALIHRDYYINSTIKIFIFTNRVEIISPGKLPNSLTVEKIKSGISIHRNPILNSLGQYLLPYSGLGSGIKRIVKYSPDVQFVNDVNKEEFKCILKRLSDSTT